mmetsp:Transcript_19197/g.29099  ORF Transcript_19197/g.29099 Transcript_19197/m.29099 type:complete len:277 (-) Transcript_19197:1413-2243(-)
MTTTVRSGKQIEYTRKAFEEAKMSYFVDDGGNLKPAGKKVSRDPERSKGPNFSWILSDISNDSSQERRHLAATEDHIDELLHPNKLEIKPIKLKPRDPPPFAVGGLWDEPKIMFHESENIKDETDNSQYFTENDQIESPPNENEDYQEEVKEDLQQDEEIPAPPIEEEEETVVPVDEKKKKKKKKKKRLVSGPLFAGPRRRFLVINQPLTSSTTTPVRRNFESTQRRAPPSPQEPPMVTRHFKSPIIENERYPPARPDYHTEYDKFAWPNPELRLR